MPMTYQSRQVVLRKDRNYEGLMLKNDEKKEIRAVKRKGT